MNARLLLLLCAVATAANAGTGAPDALWRKGDYRAAFAQTFEVAQQGDPHAQFLIGEAYRLGRSVDPNLPLAGDWYARAARQGDVAAATELGLIEAGQHRPDQALIWLSFAALHGEPRALCSLAALYFNGDGVAPDPVLAYALMARAAAAGLPEAKERLGILRTALTPETRAKGETLAAGQWAGALRPAGPIPALRAASPIETTQDIRVQVGAFKSAALAENAWAYLVGHVDGIGRNDHAVVRAGAFYRLQARLPGADAAAAFCRQLKAARWQHFTRVGRT